MQLITPKKCLALVFALAVGAGLQPAQGVEPQAAWRPQQPIRIVVPFSAGGGTDVAARMVAQGLSDALGQAVVVDNKPGASGAIGSDIVYTAPPDGLTLLVGTADTQAMNPHVNKVRYETMRYVPVGGIAKVPFVLVGRPGLPAASLKELLELTRRKSLTYGSSGLGAGPHVQMAMFADAAKVTNLLHVPYQGAAPAFQALIAGQVDLSMVPVVLALQYRDKLRFYGIASLTRNDAIRDVPTLAEQGYKVDADSWNGLLAPPGTPEATVQAIAEKLAAVVAQPETQRRLREAGMTPFAGPRAEFADFYRSEYGKWGAAIRAAGITQAQ